MATPQNSKIALPPLQPLPHTTDSHRTTASPPKPSTPSTKSKHSSSHSSLNEAQRWHHLSTRTPPSIPFIYAVLTTKIYCLPTCPSRLARRANIVFFANPKEAEGEGFRACKRCKPDLSPSFIPASTSNLSNAPAADGRRSSKSSNVNDDEMIPNGEATSPAFDPTDPSLRLHQAITLVRSHAQSGEKISLAQLAQEVGLSKWHLQRAFKRRCGRSPREMGEELLKERKESIDNNLTEQRNATESVPAQGSAEIPNTDETAAPFNALSPFSIAQDPSLDISIPGSVDMDLDLWNLNTQLETDYKLASSPQSYHPGAHTGMSTGDVTPTGSSLPPLAPSDRLTESTSSYATTPAPSNSTGTFSPLMMDTDTFMSSAEGDFAFDPHFYPEGFSPDVEGVLRDLFPEIYDENITGSAMMEGADMMVK